jgi:ABC-type transport system involved in multi-copper enzyme maturation permease subunit
MTTLTTEPMNAREDRQRLGGVVRSEWTKFIALRSSRFTLLAFPVTGVALGVLIAVVSGARWPQASAQTRANWDPTNNVLAGLIPGYLLIPILGMLMITSEYTHGAIRSTLGAVPRRPLVLAAKAIVLSSVAFVVCEAVTFVTFLIGQQVMGSAPHATLGQPGVVRALVLSGAYLALMGLFGLGLGAVIRHSGAGVAVYAAVVVVGPLILNAFPGNLWRFGPIIILANSVSAVTRLPDVLSPWVGFGTMAAYTAVALVAGFVALCRRDA